eukprot:Sro375_g129540.2  (380) ;mRNA; r:58446-59585
MAALQDPQYYHQSYQKVLRARGKFVEALQRKGFHVTDGVANFVCIHGITNAAPIVDQCRKRHGVFLRMIDASTIRIAARLDDNGQEKILEALCAATGEATNKHEKHLQTPLLGQIYRQKTLHPTHYYSWHVPPETVLVFAAFTCLAMSCVLQTDKARYLFAGLAISPMILAFLLMMTPRNNGADTTSLPLLLHQLLATMSWTATLFLVDLNEYLFLGFTLGVFASELTILPRDDIPTCLHHLSAVGLILVHLFYALTDDRMQLTAVNWFCAVSCPSYTCVPKLCQRFRLFAKPTQDAVWCAALLLWVFGRVLTLHHVLGFGYYRLPIMTAPWLEHETLLSPIYYSYVVATVLLFGLYAVNIYWSYKKLHSVQKTAAKYL